MEMSFSSVNTLKLESLGTLKWYLNHKKTGNMVDELQQSKNLLHRIHNRTSDKIALRLHHSFTPLTTAVIHITWNKKMEVCTTLLR